MSHNLVSLKQKLSLLLLRVFCLMTSSKGLDDIYIFTLSSYDFNLLLALPVDSLYTASTMTGSVPVNFYSVGQPDPLT